MVVPTLGCHGLRGSPRAVIREAQISAEMAEYLFGQKFYQKTSVYAEVSKEKRYVQQR